jgi:RNA polymerase sigma-70 factor, ECF subfamily
MNESILLLFNDLRAVEISRLQPNRRQNLLSNRRMDKTETEAIRDVLAGNRDAYRVLMDRHFCSVTRLAFRIVGNEADAEEAAQEAFLRAYNKLPSFRQDSAFSTWIMRIAMNTAINLVERRKRDLSYYAPRIEDEPSTNNDSVRVADRNAGPEASLLNREAASLRQAAMAELTPMERTAFTLRHMEDIPIAEIAAALHITSNSAKQAVFRAVSKLRRSLTPIAGGLR